MKRVAVKIPKAHKSENSIQEWLKEIEIMAYVALPCTNKTNQRYKQQLASKYFALHGNLCERRKTNDRDGTRTFMSYLLIR